MNNSPALSAALAAIDAEFSGPRMTCNSVAVNATHWTLRAEWLSDIELQLAKLKRESLEHHFDPPLRDDARNWWIVIGVTIP